MEYAAQARQEDREDKHTICNKRHKRTQQQHTTGMQILENYATKKSTQLIMVIYDVAKTKTMKREGRIGDKNKDKLVQRLH